MAGEEIPTPDKATLHQRHKRRGSERSETHHTNTTQKRRVDLERRILSGRADQRDGALLDVGQKGILLRLIETVDLVNEQHGSCSMHSKPLTRLSHNLAYLFDAP